MQYMLVLAHDPDEWVTDDDEPGASGEHDDGVHADWATYTRALADAGVLVGGVALHGIDTATTVRVRNGERLLSDGPYADVKEHLIGYYLLECPDLDDALNWAARVPNVRTGSVEVRPVIAGSSVADVLGTTA